MKYLSHAFWLRLPIPGLGGIPLNALLFIGLMVFGTAEFLRLGNAGFWFLGLGLEVSYLFILMNSRSFRRWVDSLAQEAQEQHQQQALEAKRTLLIKRLNAGNHKRFASLEKKILHISTLEQENNVEAYLIQTNQQALQKLHWMYLKLLTAEENILDTEWHTREQEVNQRLQQLEQELADPKLADATRESMQATAELLRKRLKNVERREQTLKEIRSDLTHIEAQIDLALENAAMDGQLQMASNEIEMVSDFLQTMQNDFYGQSQKDIEEVDRLFD